MREFLTQIDDVNSIHSMITPLNIPHFRQSRVFLSHACSAKVGFPLFEVETGF